MDTQTWQQRASDPRTEALFQRQLSAAHLVVLTKTAPDDNVAILRDAIGQLVPGRPVLSAGELFSESDQTDRGASAQILLGAAMHGARPALPALDHAYSGFAVETITWSVPKASGPFFALLDVLPSAVYRLKGWVWLVDAGTPDAATCVDVQAAGPHWRVSDHIGTPDCSELVVIGRAGDTEFDGFLGSLKALPWSFQTDGEPSPCFLPRYTQSNQLPILFLYTVLMIYPRYNQRSPQPGEHTMSTSGSLPPDPPEPPDPPGPPSPPIPISPFFDNSPRRIALRNDPPNTLGQQITTLCAHINVADYHLLTLIAQFDAEGLYGSEEFASTAHWLNYRCGMSLGSARERVRVARALESLPKVAHAFKRGYLSYSKAQAISRVATAENETFLVNLGRWTTAAQLERSCRQYRQCQEEVAPEVFDERVPTAEWQHYVNDSGELVFRGRLPPELGEVVLSALQQRVDAFPPEEGELLTERRANALVLMAEVALAASTTDADGETRSSSADRYQIHVEINEDETHIDGGSGLREATVERLLCDASVVMHQRDKHGEPLSVGRKTRTIPTAIRRALRRRDKGCRFPGCTNYRYVDAHHVRHWAHGGETKLSNLVLLCSTHHAAVHERGFRVEANNPEPPERGSTRFTLYTPGGKELPPVADHLTDGNVETLMRKVSAETPIDPADLLPQFYEARPQYDEVVMALMSFVTRNCPSRVRPAICSHAGRQGVTRGGRSTHRWQRGTQNIQSDH